MVQIYPHVFLDQIKGVPHGEFISTQGNFFRYKRRTYLQHQGQKLRLIGEPFSWLPCQGARVQVTGELLRGQEATLVLHDCRPVNADEPSTLTYADYSEAKVGDEIVMLAHTRNIGDTQIAVTSIGESFIVVGRELDERKYAIQAKVVTLDPPTMVLVSAVPLTSVNPMSTQASA